MMIASTDNDLSEADFKLLSNLVYQHCGINLHEGKRDLVRARVFKRLRARCIETLGDYLRLVETDPSGQEFFHLIDAISTNLTSFVRESRHFDYLKGSLLPDIMRRKQSSSPRLRA